MMINEVFTIGNLFQIVTTVIGVTALYIRLETHVGYLRKDIEELTQLPLSVARHDERIKNLEKK